MNKEIIINVISETIYRNETYQIVGNRSILAANQLLAKCYITDIEYICELAKVINNVLDLEFSDNDIITIENKLKTLIRRYKESHILEDV